MKIDNTDATVTITTKGITITADEVKVKAGGGITISGVEEIVLKRTRKGFVAEIPSDAIVFEKDINIA